MNTTTEDDEMTAFFDGLSSHNNPSPTPHKEIARQEPPPEQRHKCLECDGTGIWKGVRIHQPKRECFACKGKGYFLKSYADRMKAREKAQQAKIRKAAKAMNLFDENHPGLRTKMEQFKWASFVATMLETLTKYGNLTERQVEAVQSTIMKIEVKLAEKKAVEASKTGEVDISKIIAMFDKAKENGLHNPKYRTQRLRFSLPKSYSQNAGAIYVKCDGQYAGKIMDGKFKPVREAPDDILEIIRKVAADPLGSAKEYGHKTGKCSCCGRTLSNKESIALGIGPICATGWGL